MTFPSQNTIDQNSIKVLADAVTKAIGENGSQKRFIDLERIPLICLSVSNMNKTLEDIKQMIVSNRTESDKQHGSFLTKENFHLEFDPIASIFKWIVMGVSGTVGLALLAAFFALILK